MGLVTSAIARSADVVKYRTNPKSTAAYRAAIPATRRLGPSNPDLYRNWAIHSPWIRTAFDIRIGQLALAEWDLVPKNRDAAMPDPGLMRRMRELLEVPNDGVDSFSTFVSKIGEDILTLDAGSIEKERTVGGRKEIVSLWDVDGGRVFVNRYWSGDVDEPRYHFRKGPGIDDYVDFRNDDFIYMMLHPRSYAPIGFSPLETLRETIDAELTGSLYNARVVNQAMPDGIMDLGESARPEQVDQFKAFFESEIMGRGAMAFWGGTKGAQFIDFGRDNVKMQYMDWILYLVRKIAGVLQLSPQDLGLLFDVNRATGEVQQEQTEDRGLKTFLNRVQNYITTEFCWDPAWGGRSNNIAFRFPKVGRVESTRKAQEAKVALAGMPYESVNGWRLSIGLPPIGDQNDKNNPFNQLMANTPLGLVVIDESHPLPSAYDVARIQSAEASADPQLQAGGEQGAEEEDKL